MRILIFITFLFSLFMTPALGQMHDPIYTKVEIDLVGKSLRELARAGVDVTHGKYVKGRSFTATFGDWELEEIEKQGFTYSIKIPDIQKFYEERNQGNIAERGGAECEISGPNFTSPQNFELGAMGGFFTYDQMLDHLDAMAFTYPNLITQKKAISPIKTHLGNDILFLKISDNVSEDENEPEILFTALHHAREPISMSQMIYFMWYLLENYDTDPEVRDILNSTELFFIPCINPDGYKRNVETHPNGGGMWRKNMRDNDLDGTHDISVDGVDINRNYGFKWGFDNDGSAGNFEAETYRGPAPFSEPETQAVRDFVLARSFEFAYNYHSYGNVLLYPFGYDPEVSNDKAEIYQNFSEVLTRDNKYTPGTSITALEYPTNGDANDWMFGGETKPAILTFTPEVGSSEDDFYPAKENIVKLCKQTLSMNLTMAKLPHSFGLITNANNSTLTELNNNLNFSLKNYGTLAANFSVNIEPVSEFIDWYTTGDKWTSLNSLEHSDMEFSYKLLPNTPAGSKIGFVVKANNGTIVEHDTIYKIYSPNGAIVHEDGNILNNWSRPGSSAWGSTSEDSYEGLTSFTDSPFGNYEKNTERLIQLKKEVDLTKANDAYLEFWAKWEINAFFDYAMLQISVNNGPWTNMCGRHTINGSIFQAPDQPVYDGFQTKWVHEQIPLSDYIGQKVKFRFAMVADGFLEYDGFYFDEFIVTVLGDESTAFETVEKDGFIFETVRPNPALNTTQIPVTLLPQNNSKNVHIVVTDLLGRQLIELPVESNAQRQLIQLNISELQPGTYFCSLRSNEGILSTQTLIVGSH